MIWIKFAVLDRCTFCPEENSPMRYFFDIRDRLVVHDRVGRDFSLAADAIVYAKYLAADIRCLSSEVRPQSKILVRREDSKAIHEEPVLA